MAESGTAAIAQDDKKKKTASVKRVKTETAKKPDEAAPKSRALGPKKKTPRVTRFTQEHFLNRELTWLNFNRRVMNEARDKRTPLLERLKFVAIICTNLDEFFMKRIGGLKQLVGAGVTEIARDGRTPAQQINECHEVIRKIEAEKKQLFQSLLKELSEQGIHLLNYSQITDQERESLREQLFNEIYPLVTPQGIDPAHPFPFISNLSLNLLVRLIHPGHGEPYLARVKIPVGADADLPRFIKVGDRHRYVRLEEVVSHNLDLLFPKVEILSADLFRVTRNAVTEMDEEQADDLLAMIETELRYRKFAEVVRLQVLHTMSPTLRGMLAAEMRLDENADVFDLEGIMGKSDLMEIASLKFPELHDPPFAPIDHPRLKDKTKIFYKVRREGPILLFHPYESFSSSVERFLQEAAEDPKVRAIKMTLYRTSEDSKVIHYLVNAARNGKQVTVVVELKARFDEAANIQWANHLEEAGIHVTYGVVGLKTHGKVILVVRKDYNGLRRYAHFSTGNYHSGTARLYTDFGLFTCDPGVGADLTEFFNYLSTACTPKRNYKKLIVAPSYMKKTLIDKIRQEMFHQMDGSVGEITIKTNAMQDSDIIEALYRASQAGVKINLIVRDTCSLRPGVPGVSENIRVISIVGRFLEHARVYYFRNGGKSEYYIGSADCMTRNLESRVEVLVPVEEPSLRQELATILKIQLNDKRSAWEMQPDGEYVQIQPNQPGEEVNSQELLIALANKRQKGPGLHKRLKSRGKSRKEFWHFYYQTLVD